MKQTIINIKKVGFFFVLIPLLLACNKENNLTKAVSIEIAGYNIGNSELEVSVDELVYDKFRTPANKRLDFARIYTYPATKNGALLKIKDIVPGKEVFQQQLQLGTGEIDRFFPFVIINGSPLEIKSPEADPSTNKMAFYIYYPQSDDAVDIFLKNDAGQIYYIAKNIQSAMWVYTDYLTPEVFKDSSKNYTLYFTKTGTTDHWAFRDSEQISKSPAGGSLFFPTFGEKGLTRTYFITPGSNQLDVVSLFKRPN